MEELGRGLSNHCGKIKKKKQRKEKVKLLSEVMAAGVYILCMRLEVFSFLLQVYQWSIKPQNWYQNSSMGKLAPELRQTSFYSELDTMLVHRRQPLLFPLVNPGDMNPHFLTWS